jgi:hypothetical protein
MKIFYSPSYTVAAYSFETTRKSQWIAESLAREPIAGIELCGRSMRSRPSRTVA